MIDNNRFLYLLEKYKDGTCSGDEYDEFFSLILTNELDEPVKESIGNDFLNDTCVSTNLPPHVSQEIVRNILSADKNVHQIARFRSDRYSNRFRWLTAACVFVLVGLISFFYLTQHDGRSFSSIIPKSDIFKENRSTQQLRLMLPDSSFVVLHPEAKIHYPAQFAGEQREVYLEGDAFFEVSHNPSKPFLVYCNDIITKVLGTSFNIITDKKNGDIEVAVKTGRVQVYENEHLLEALTNAKPIILTANQRVLYSKEKRKIVSTIVENPAPITNGEVLQDSFNIASKNHVLPKRSTLFIYDQATLEDVFEDIQRDYGIELVVENSDLNNCVFTGDVSNKDLFVLLKIICLSTNSDYEVVGTKILIKGKGCAR